MSVVIKDYARVYLFIINTITTIVGLVITFLGIYCTSKSNQQPFSSIEIGSLLAFIVLTIAIGLFVFAMGVSGIIGSINQSPAMMNAYVRLMAVVLILEGALIVGCFVAKAGITERADAGFAHLVKAYNTKQASLEMQGAVDGVHEHLQCCGYVGEIDFTPVPPPSCCSDSRYLSFNDCPERALFSTGCMVKLPHFVGNCIYLITLSLGFALVLDIISMVGALYVKEHSPKYVAG